MWDFLNQLLVLDTECTHADPELAEIVELAVAKHDHVWHFESCLFGSQQPMPPAASAVTHIHADWLRGKPTFIQSMDKVFGMLVTDRAYFVSHNTKYDRQVLGRHLHQMEPELARMCVDPDRWICTLRLSKWAWPQSASHAQNYLRYAVNLDVDHTLVAHRAEPDTRICVALLERIVQELVHQGLLDVNQDLPAQLVQLSQQPIMLQTWPFGKHKGKTFKELDTDYLLWCVDNMKSLNEQDPEFDPDLAESVRVTLERRLMG